MVDPKSKFVAERWGWHSISSWMVPSLLVPIVLATVFIGYVIVEAAN